MINKPDIVLESLADFIRGFIKTSFRMLHRTKIKINCVKYFWDNFDQIVLIIKFSSHVSFVELFAKIWARNVFQSSKYFCFVPCVLSILNCQFLKVFSRLIGYEGITLIRKLNGLWLRSMSMLKIKTEWLHEDCFSFLETFVFSRTFLNRPRSIYQYSNMAPRLSGQNCKFF